MQLARQVPVLRQDRAEDRETVEGGVRGQHQDQRGDAGDEVEPGGETVEDRVGQLGDQGLLAVALGNSAELLGGPLGDLHPGLDSHQNDAHQQRDRGQPEQQQGGRGVAGLGLAECRHPVADRLNPGQRRATGRKSPGHKENQGQTGDIGALGLHLETGRLGLQVTAQHMDLEETPAEHRQHAEDERVGRHGEGRTRFPDTPQIGRRQQQNSDHRERHLVVGDERDSRSDIGHRRCHRHRDREGVVDQQRTGDRQPGGRPQVGGDHLVVAAAGGVGVHVLPVGRDDDEHHHSHRHADPRREGVGRQPRHREHQEHLFGRVGDRRHRIGGEHRQRDALGQQRVTQPVASKRTPDQQPPSDGRQLGHESQG